MNRRVTNAKLGAVYLTARRTELRLADVADRADVSRQAVYLHFGDRAGLVLGLLGWVDETSSWGSCWPVSNIPRPASRRSTG